MRGRLIVIEGTDGSGKSTQFGQLCQRLDAMGQEDKKLVFPGAALRSDPDVPRG